MRLNTVMKLCGGTALAAALGLASAANAVDSPIAGTGFAGVAGNGDSGTDAFGQPWVWSYTIGGYGVPAGLSAWGVPGLGAGVVDQYDGSVPATDFYVSFLTSGTGTYINTTPSSGSGGYNEETRMTVNGVAWTPEYAPGGDPLEVNFIAPAGQELVYGDLYFVNVVFTTGKISGSNAGFSAVYSAGTVPEAPTWAMMILGVAAVGGAMRSARRKDSAPALGA